MARRNMTNFLIKKESIQEEMRLIKGSDTDYVTPTGNIYKDMEIICSIINLYFPTKIMDIYIVELLIEKDRSSVEFIS